LSKDIELYRSDIDDINSRMSSNGNDDSIKHLKKIICENEGAIKQVTLMLKDYIEKVKNRIGNEQRNDLVLEIQHIVNKAERYVEGH
ncbi:MAG: hypothetical protein MHPSP_003101, partial [Paramarteilia canceri]